MHGNILATDLKDGHKIYGYLDKAPRGQGRLVVVSHGLAGHPEEYLHVMARNVFNANGYDVLRLFYYSKYPKARMLRNCTYAIHAGDLAEVTAALRSQYRWIGMAGHSSGGLVILMTNPPVEAISLWEPPFIKTYFTPHARPVEGENLYSVGRGSEFLISAELYRESVERDKEYCLPLAQNLKAPAQLMLSESGRRSPDMEILYENLPEPKEKAVVTGADHLFTLGDTAVKLIRHTCKWFERF